jgi:hypothetical protein
VFSQVRKASFGSLTAVKNTSMRIAVIGTSKAITLNTAQVKLCFVNNQIVALESKYSHNLTKQCVTAAHGW